jgi:hypothetical protein
MKIYLHLQFDILKCGMNHATVLKIYTLEDYFHDVII